MSKKIKTIEELKDKVVKDYKHEYGDEIDKFEQALIGMFEQAIHELIDSCPECGNTGDSFNAHYIKVSEWKKQMKGIG